MSTKCNDFKVYFKLADEEEAIAIRLTENVVTISSFCIDVDPDNSAGFVELQVKENEKNEVVREINALMKVAFEFQIIFESNYLSNVIKFFEPVITDVVYPKLDKNSTEEFCYTLTITYSKVTSHLA